MLSRNNRLRDRRDFAAITRDGRRWHNDTLTLSVMPRQDGNPSRFGFVVSRKVGTAVVRNQIKRRLRAIIRHHLPNLVQGHDLAFIARPAASGAAYALMESSTLDLLRRVGLVVSVPEAS